MEGLGGFVWFLFGDVIVGVLQPVIVGLLEVLNFGR
jgi:hypothetical protein